MKERDRIVVTFVFGLLLLAWLGVLVHSSARFAGSGAGSAFGIAGALLMLVPLAYPVVKRISFLNDRITPHVSLQSWLKLHVYAGIIGPLLGIIHTGHKFDSALGVMLTAVMLLVVVSGFAGRYLLSYANQEMKDNLLLLQTARGDLDAAWGALEGSRPAERPRQKLPLLASLQFKLQLAGPEAEVTRIAGAVADLEFAVRSHELFKRWSRRWLRVHLALSVLLYGLLALHVSSSIYFGLRWLR